MNIAESGLWIDAPKARRPIPGLAERDIQVDIHLG